MPVSGALPTATLVETQQILSVGVFLGEAPPPYKNFYVRFGLPTPTPTSTGEYALTSLRIELSDAVGGRTFIAPAGACSITVEEAKMASRSGKPLVAFKGSGRCTAPAVERPSSGTATDAGAADGGAAASLTVGTFTFANTFYVE